MDRALRARVLMAEATDLGVTIDDLNAAATALEVRSAPVTVAEFVATIAPTFSPNTAATYATYWRLAVARLGGRRIGEVIVEDCATVVADAEQRAQSSRASSDGRSSRENCVAALRALFTCAQSAGLIGVNPAAAISSLGGDRAAAVLSTTPRSKSSSTPCAPRATTRTSTCS